MMMLPFLDFLDTVVVVAVAVTNACPSGWCCDCLFLFPSFVILEVKSAADAIAAVATAGAALKSRRSWEIVSSLVAAAGGRL
jgi:hypothetical protein